MFDTHPRPYPRAAVPRAHTPIGPGVLARGAWLAHRVTARGDAASGPPAGRSA